MFHFSVDVVVRQERTLFVRSLIRLLHFICLENDFIFSFGCFTMNTFFTPIRFDSLRLVFIEPNKHK